MPRGRTTHAAGPASTGTAPISASSTPPSLPVTLGLAGKWGSQPGCHPPAPHFASLTRESLPRLALSAPSHRHTSISNRHLMQLEIAATPAKSATSLFLIDTKQHLYPIALRVADRKRACRAACPLPISHAATSIHSARTTHPPSFSNRHLAQLKFTATPTKSTTLLFLIDTNRPHFACTHFHSPETLVAQARPACVRFLSPSAGTHSISTVYSLQLEIAATPTPSTKLSTLLGTHSRVRLVAIRLRRPAVAFLAPLGNTFPESSGGLL